MARNNSLQDMMEVRLGFKSSGSLIRYGSNGFAGANMSKLMMLGAELR